MDREFDIIIFGATGYTGRYVIEELANSTAPNEIKWAIAGRNTQKLKESLEIVQAYLDGIDIMKTPIIQADVGDTTSISNMCKRAKLILNCVGPYKLYGEVVVQACVENKTHHVDLSGEFHFLETTQAKYFAAAREKGVYIVEACGFDSIPGDYGISFLKKNFPGDLNSVEYYIEIEQGSEGRSTNIGTFVSAVDSVRDLFKAKKYDAMLKESVFKKEMVQSKYRLPFRLPLFYSDVVKGWCFWFIGPDERIIRRSQMFRYEYLNDRPVQSNGFVKVPSLFTAFYIMMFAAMFGFLSLFSLGRYLLKKYPSFFTAGAFTTTGPSRKQVEQGKTKLTFIGEGWKEKLSEPTDQHITKPDTKYKLTISGGEPAYALTSMCMVHAGLVILQENQKMPLEGGVLTPGVAFENTTLSERLQKRGMVFKLEKV